MEQEALTTELAAPSEHTIYARFKLAPKSKGEAWTIDPGAWRDAVQAGGFVGTCGRCGDYLQPRPAQHVNANRVDFEAVCRTPRHDGARGGEYDPRGCGAEFLAPYGRLRSAHQSARPKGF